MPDTDRATARSHDKYERLIKRAQQLPSIAMAVAHPCDPVSLESAVEAARLGFVRPVLVGPLARIRDVAAGAKLDISSFELVDAEHSVDSAVEALPLLRAGKVEALMKGALTDELMGAVVAREGRHPHRPPHQPLLHHGRPGHADA